MQVVFLFIFLVLTQKKSELTFNMSSQTIDISKQNITIKRDNELIDSSIYKPNFVLIANNKSNQVNQDYDSYLANDPASSLADLLYSSKVIMICLWSFFFEIVNNTVYQAYLLATSTLEFLDNLPATIRHIYRSIKEYLAIIFDASTRSLWWFNTRLEIIKAISSIFDILYRVFGIFQKMYLAGIVVVVLGVLNFAAMVYSAPGSTGSALSKTLESKTLYAQESTISTIDSNKIVALSLINQEANQRDILLLDRVIIHETKPTETLDSLAESYGVKIETIAYNNGIDEGAYELPEKILIPWANGYIYKVESEISAEDLSDIYKIDKNLIKQENEQILKDGRFDKDSYVFLPTEDFESITKYNEEEEQRKTNLRKAEEARKAREDALAKAERQTYVQTVSSQKATAGFIWPTTGSITRCVVGSHIACDIANPSAPAIFSVQNGTVAAVYRYSISGYGLAVLVNHDNGLQTLYAHMSEIYVGEGQSVKQGQSIGRMGCTGLCFGTHLHFEVRKNGIKQNPLNYLP